MTSKNRVLRAIVVDDERLGRDRVCMLAAKRTDLEIVAECSDGRQAVQRIRELQPDLVFLDVQMPDLDGIGVVREIGPDLMPAVIFITAYDEHAVEAFEVHALDYLLKPFRADRFSEAVSRVSQIVARGQHSEEQNLDDLVSGRRRYVDRILVKGAKKAYFVRAERIDWIEAAGNYLKLHASDKTHLIRQTLGRLERQLDPDEFVRVHRSAIVNLGSVRELSRRDSGEYEVVLVGGKHLKLSRGYRHRLDRFDPLADRFAR